MKAAFKYVLLCSAIAMSGTLLYGCKENQAPSAGQADKPSQAEIDQRNAEIARKNTVRNQIK